MIINNQAENNKAIEIINDIDLLIQKAYIDIEESTDETRIIDTQELIDDLNLKRISFFNEIVKYQTSIKPSQQEEVYVVRDGVLLSDVALLYYGERDYWQYIYDYNQLTDLNLTIGTELIIPKLPDNPEASLYWNDIVDAEIINRLIEVGEINI